MSVSPRMVRHEDPSRPQPRHMLSDAALVDRIAAELATPRIDPADSFVLHASLELMARTALLPWVAPDARAAARARIESIGRQWRTFGPGREPPPPRAHSSIEAGVAALAGAIRAGDLDDVDAEAAWLAATCTAPELRDHLSDLVLPSLAAAAHGGIFLFQLPRIALRHPWIAHSLRSLAIELAREREWQLSWHRRTEPSVEPSIEPSIEPSSRIGPSLTEVLLAPRSAGDPGSDFIFPVMSLVERSGLAAELLAGPCRATSPSAARRDLARVAAWSMLQDQPSAAPYGWSHCLTMPQGALGVAASCSDPGDAIAVAATYVLGFRATAGRVRLDPQWHPEPPPRSDPREMLAASPNLAAAAVWHAPDELVPDLVGDLATHAATHADAHLVKYTLACFDAAAVDREASRLHLSAAAYLGAWWRAVNSR